MSTRIRNAQGILSSDVPTGNLLWVDAVNGVDGLAVRGRLTIPFRTLTAAKAAAQSGDTIIVLPGVYDEYSLAKNGVNWHFLPGARVEYSGSSGEIFNTAIVGSACTFSVTGRGIFKTTNLSSQETILVLNYSGDSVTFEFDSIESRGNAFKVWNGGLRANGDEILATGSIAMEFSSGTIRLCVGKIKSTAGAALYCSGGSCIADVEAVRMESTASDTVLFYAGSVSIAAYEILSSAGRGVYYDNIYNNRLSIRQARVVSSYGPSNGEAVYVAAGGGLSLAGCTLIAQHASVTYSLNAASAGTNVQFHGYSIGNKVSNNISPVGPALLAPHSVT